MLTPNDLVFSSVPVARVPLLDRLEPVASAGFAGISVLPYDVLSLEAAGMAAAEITLRIADCGLLVAEVDSIGTWLPCQQNVPPQHFGQLLRELTVERVLPLAARIGARSVTLVEMHGVAPSLDEAAGAFAAVCDRAAEYGLLVHIEFLPFGGIPDLKAAWEIVKAAGRENGCLTIDSWHLFRSGSTLDELAAIPGAHIGTVQINDAPSTPEGTLFDETMCGRRLPGEGEFDLTGLIHTLDRIGSCAPIGVEVFSAVHSNLPVGEVARAWAQAARQTIGRARQG